MSFGYTCDWCNSRGKSKSSDQREPNPLPNGWAKLSYSEHVCDKCLNAGRAHVKSSHVTYRGDFDPRTGPERDGGFPRR